MKLDSLAVIGLTNGEIKVFEAVLAVGIATINTIHEQTGFERRAIYDIINKLIEKGLLSYTIEEGKKTYQCAPPNVVKAAIEKKKQELHEAQKLLPQLRVEYTAKKPQVRFETYRGKKGMKTIFEDMLNYKNVYVIGGGFYLVKELPHFWPQYNKRRIKAQCTWHNLVIWELKEKIPETEYLKAKVLPKEFSGNPVAILVYGNKVVNLSWGEEMFAFVTESKNMTQNYKKYHKYLWTHVGEKI
jgi:sugar-specific transcriptional regulator TrmB